LVRDALNEEIEAAKVTNVKLHFNLPSNLYMSEQLIEFEQLTERSTEITALVYALNNKFPYT